MKLSELITELQQVQSEHGDIEVQLQENPKEPDDLVICSPDFFVVPEKYEDEGVIVNIRSWPY